MRSLRAAGVDLLGRFRKPRSAAIRRPVLQRRLTLEVLEDKRLLSLDGLGVESLESGVERLESRVESPDLSTLEGGLSTEIIVKLRESESPEALIQQGYLARQAHNDATLSRLKEQYGLGDERPVFQNLHERVESRESRVESSGLWTLDVLPGEGRLFPVYALQTDEDPLAISSLLSEDPAVEYAQPNYLRQTFDAALPDDYFVNDGGAWRSGSWGQPYADMWGLQKIQAAEAWAEFSDAVAQEQRTGKREEGRGRREEGGGKAEPWQPGPSLPSSSLLSSLFPTARDATGPGEGVVVAVLDSGLYYYHEDLQSNIWINQGEIPENGIDDDQNGYVDDYIGYDFSGDAFAVRPQDVQADWDPIDTIGHGTHVAGIIAAVGNNSVGVIGVAPAARIMPLKIFPNAYDTVAAEAIYYAVQAGADVLNASWGGPGSSPLLADAFDYAQQAGSVSVAAAGNDGFDAAGYAPANIDSVIAVAASTPDDRKAGFSNYGFVVDLAAPGGGYPDELGTGASDQYNVLSTMADTSELAQESPELNVSEFEHYWRLAGTSMASPYVAGAAAVVLGTPGFEDLPPEEVRARIMAGASPWQYDGIDAENPAPPFAVQYAGRLGTGRLNVYNALTIAEPGPLLKVMGLEESQVVLNPVVEKEELSIGIQLKNFWRDTSEPVTATLASLDPRVTVVEPGAVAEFESISSGEVVSNQDSPFIVRFDEQVSLGEAIGLRLTIRHGQDPATGFDFDVAMAMFRDAGPQSGLPLNDILPLSAAMADYDGDGRPDVYYSGYAAGSLYRNLGDGSFESVTLSAGVGGIVDPNTQLFFDFDNDGDRDLWINDGSTYAPRNSLYLNDGAGTLTNISQQSGVRDQQSFTVNLIALDADGDGLTDVYTGRDLYFNNGDLTFSRVGSGDVGLPLLPSVFTRQIVPLDYDQDGDQDLLIQQAIYRNHGDGTFGRVDGALQIDPAHGTSEVHGAAAGDFNSDGYLDVFLTALSGTEPLRLFGGLLLNSGDGTFADVSQAAGPIADGTYGFWHGTDFFDFDNDGDLDLHITNQAAMPQGNLLYENSGDGTLADVTPNAFPEEVSPGMGPAAIGDYNGDGALDIYAPAGSGRGSLLENRAGLENNWIKIHLEGTTSNRDAFGAKVYVTTADAVQVRQVHTSAVEAQPLHFGLGQRTRVDAIEIHWPSGLVQRLDGTDANQIRHIVEPQVDIPLIDGVSIVGMDSAVGLVGDRLAIAGRNFGETQQQRHGRVEFHQGLTAEIVSWSDTLIESLVPEGVAFQESNDGNFHVITDAGRSRGIYFRMMVPPPAPSDLELEIVASQGIRLTWHDNARTEEDFEIERSIDQGPFVSIGVVAVDAELFLDAAAVPDGTNAYQVRARNRSGSSGPSNTVSVYVENPPAMPGNFSARLVGPNIELTWDDASDNEDRFELYESRPDSAGNFELLAALTPGAESFQRPFNSLAPGRTYYYKILARNEFGDSEFSDTVPAAMPRLTAPSGLAAFGVSSSELGLAWENESLMGDGFEVHRSSDGVSFGYVATVAYPDTIFVDSGRASQTEYYYRVRAYSDYGGGEHSDYSEVVSAATFRDYGYGIELQQYVITDDWSGETYRVNGDGLLGPGERVELALELNNSGGSTIYDLSAVLTLVVLPGEEGDGWVELLSGEEASVSLPMRRGESRLTEGPFVLEVRSDLPPDLLAAVFQVDVTVNGNPVRTERFSIPLADAAAVAVPEDFQISDDTNRHSIYTGMTSDDSGHVYAVWQRSSGSYNGDIYFNYSDDYGATWQPEDIRLDVGSAKSHYPILRADNHGNVYVAWVDDRNHRTDQNGDVYFNYSHDYGVTWQAQDIRLPSGNSPGSSRVYNLDMGSDDLGNVYVVWDDNRDGELDLYFTRSQDRGVTWQADPVRLDASDAPGRSEATSPALGWDDNGHVYVVWADARNSESRARRDIYFRHSEDYGATWPSDEVRLETGDAPGASTSADPSISCDDNGNVYVLWEDYRNNPPTEKGDVYFNYSGDHGATWQAEDVRLNVGDAPGASDSFYTVLASDDGGNVYAVWSDRRDGKSDIYFNRSDDYGATWQTDDLRLNTTKVAGSSSSYTGGIAIDGDGNVYVAWSDRRNNADAWYSDIYFNYSVDGGATWLENDRRLDTTDPPGASRSTGASVSADVHGNVYVAWSDRRNGTNDVFFSYAMPDQSPHLDDVARQSVEEGSLLEFEVMATDGRKMPLEFFFDVRDLPQQQRIAIAGAVLSAPVYDGSTGESTGRFSWTPGPSASGTYGPFYVVARNPATGRSAFQEVVIRVGPPRVAGRRIFYNGSVFDGGRPDANPQDDHAIAVDKEALLPGSTATLANYTSYHRGINGIMVDIDSLPPGAEVTADDFLLRVGNSNDPGTWAAAAAPEVVVRFGEGVDGSDRITLIWPNNLIQKQWLQVTVLASDDTGLTDNDVFYFGNAIGESGNSTVLPGIGDAKVNALDMLGARDNQRHFLDPAPIDFDFDFNRDARVNAVDMLIARNNHTHFLNALKLITVPGGKSRESRVQSRESSVEGSELSAVYSQLLALDPRLSAGKLAWLYEYEATDSKRQDLGHDIKNSKENYLQTLRPL